MNAPSRRRTTAGRLLPALSLLATLIGCSREHDPPADMELQLVWQDEFDGPAGQAPDPGKWGHDIGTGWGNAQLEYDTDRTQNCSLDGEGHLVITAREEAWLGSAYTSARITTHDRFEQRYGRMEARIKLPTGQGIWPAFWMLGADFPTTYWPLCGEIDILEARGQAPSVLHNSLHGPGYSGGNAVTAAYDASPLSLNEDFHVYAVEWEAESIRWLLDDVVTLEIFPDDLPGTWVYDHPFYLILNIAVGGTFVGSPNESTVFPQPMWVDWVRVYQQQPVQ